MDVNGQASLYLDLLQASLLGLIHQDPPIKAWSPTDGKPVASPPFDLERRCRGLDWPSQAHSMIGVFRMQNLRYALETVIIEGIPGDFLEAGVWRGGASIFATGVLKFYDGPVRKVFVADSFEGLPAPTLAQDEDSRHHLQAPLAVSLEEVQANFRAYDLLDENVVFLKGWFKDTLPTAPIDQLAVLRLDGDLYESTRDGLVLYDRVSPGGFVIIDDYRSIKGCNSAVNDFRAERGITEPLIPIDQVASYWRKGR